MTNEEISKAILSRMQQSAVECPDVPGIYTVGDSNARTNLLFTIAAVNEMERVPDAVKFHFEAAWTSLLGWGYIVTDARIFHSPNRERVLLTDLGLKQDATRPIPGVSSGTEFVRDIEAVCGPIDIVTGQYLSESWDSACAHQWLSSAFMLGAASERLLTVLAEHVETALSVRRSGQASGSVKALNQWLINQIPALKAKFSHSSTEFHDLDSVLNSVFILPAFENLEFLRHECG